MLIYQNQSFSPHVSDEKFVGTSQLRDESCGENQRWRDPGQKS